MPRDEGNQLAEDRVRAEHMLEAAQQAAAFVLGRTRDDLDTDAMLRRALKDCVQEIGEAAARISDEGRDQIPTLPWEKMVGMRHILVHAYFEIDRDTLWKVATGELDHLIGTIEAALADWP